MRSCKAEFDSNTKFTKRMQPIAIAKFYLGPDLWPGCKAIEVDNEFNSNYIARALDIGGTDKILKDPRGFLIHLGQRFRRQDAWKYCDLTIRESEYERHLAALGNGGTIPEFYSYGFANKEQSDFIAFFVITYRQLMKDVSTGLFSMAYKKRWQTKQNNFYFVDWRWLPERYIHYQFIGVPIHQPVLPGFV